MEIALLLLSGLECGGVPVELSVRCNEKGHGQQRRGRIRDDSMRLGGAALKNAVNKRDGLFSLSIWFVNTHIVIRACFFYVYNILFGGVHYMHNEEEGRKMLRSQIDERMMVEEGLRKFMEDTGIDFMRLMADKQYRVKVFIEEASKTDTDVDEVELQKSYGLLSQKTSRDTQGV